MKSSIIIFLLFSTCSQAQTKPFKHDYKKFIDCRINWNIDYSLSSEEMLKKYSEFVDEEIVILTTDASKPKFTMERGFIRVIQCNNQKNI